jgi:hypothetical protein
LYPKPKNKNSEGYKRILQQVLVDRVDILLEPITNLMDLICNQQKVPEQWLFTKTIPVYKKRDGKIKLDATDQVKTCVLHQRHLKNSS